LFVERKTVQDQLVSVLLPTEPARKYVLICGEHGVGKTTLVHQACRIAKKTREDSKEAVGIVYVAVPHNASTFAEAFAKAIGYNFESISFHWAIKHLFNVPGYPTSMDLLEQVLQKLDNFSEDYTLKYKRPVVVVIDNINWLVSNKDSSVLKNLQDWAKDRADEGTIRVVFVSSEGVAPKFLQERSSWSRAMSPIEITDATEEESCLYLEKSGIPKDVANRFHQVTGGRFQLLSEVADYWSTTKSYDDIKSILILNVEKTLIDAGVLQKNSPTYNAAVAVIKVLLKKPQRRISLTEFNELVNDREIAQALISRNIFAYHPSTLTITFQSRLVEKYVEQSALVK